MSPYIPLEIRDWYSPGMLNFFFISKFTHENILNLLFDYFNYLNSVPSYLLRQLHFHKCCQIYKYVQNFFSFFPERRNSTLIFLPQLNTISVCEACASSECHQCQSRNNLSGLKGSLSKGTHAVLCSSTVLLLTLFWLTLLVNEKQVAM